MKHLPLSVSDWLSWRREVPRRKHLVLDRIAALHVSDVAQLPDGWLQLWALHLKPACWSRGAPQSTAQWQKQQVFNFISHCSRVACAISHQVKFLFSHILFKLPFIVICYVITVLPPLCFIQSSTVEQLSSPIILINSVWSCLYFHVLFWFFYYYYYYLCNYDLCFILMGFCEVFS